MGAYLSEPITEKISTDDDSNRVRYGASSMQGWRISQEDAHNCVVDFDKNTSLFAVYDGHGGHEVAMYCSQKLPDFIKNTEAYKKGDYENALIDAFLGFDATIASREVVNILKEIAGVKDDEAIEDDGEEEENVNNLYEEATMPIEQVMEKYQANLLNPHLKKLQGDKVLSPMLKARKTPGEASGVASCSSSNSGSSSSKSDSDDTSEASCSSMKNSTSNGNTSDASSSSTTSNGETKPENETADVKTDIKEESNNTCSEAKPESENKSEEIKETEVKTDEVVENKTEEEKPPVESTEDVQKEADVKEDSEEKTLKNGETVSEDKPQTNGEVVSKKGKAVVKRSPKAATPQKSSIRLRDRSAKQLYDTFRGLEDEESDSEDENDVTFDGGQTFSSSDDDSADDSCNVKTDEDDDDDMDPEDDDDDDDDNDGEEEEDEDLLEEDDNEFTRNMREEPGSDSGCTAVVALLKGNQLYVANAGDSRCVVCRNGEAIDMSFDHKPEDTPEMDRIVKAGGKVTQDGRVNGGLNLSRAIGDHAYKQNKELSDREQMITALPDIKTLTINPVEDEFMVLACDGIWNFMSSQDVVDFVKPRLNKETGPEKLSQICEELFDHCLAPHTMGDGTGCDNMTAVIIQFKQGVLKRSPTPEVKSTSEGSETAAAADGNDVEVPSAKRCKTEPEAKPETLKTDEQVATN